MQRHKARSVVFNKFKTNVLRLLKYGKHSQHPGGVVKETNTQKEANDCANRIGDVENAEEPKTNSAGRPIVCPKCKYTGKYIVAHEDGWQCLNCMKIIYRDQPLPISNSKT